MNKKKIDKKKAENYIGIGLAILPVLIFMIMPAHSSSHLDYILNHFIDNYLLGNGYYSPPNYPFAAKVVNSFSVVLAIVSGIFVGIWRKDGIESEKISKSAWLGFCIIWGLGIATFITSIDPQEFRESTLRRSFGTSESFHNNPILFMTMIVGKEICIYMAVRTFTALLFFHVDKIRK